MSERMCSLCASIVGRFKCWQDSENCSRTTCMREFASDLLGARDFAEFYKLEGQYLEIHLTWCTVRPTWSIFQHRFHHRLLS